MDLPARPSRVEASPRDAISRQCPGSEVRHALQHALMRTSESKDAGNFTKLVHVLSLTLATAFVA